MVRAGSYVTLGSDHASTRDLDVGRENTTGPPDGGPVVDRLGLCYIEIGGGAASSGEPALPIGRRMR